MRWIYKIDNNGSLTNINPLNPRQFEVKETLTDDSIYDWRTTLDGDFILMGADYLYMKTLEIDFRHQKFAFKVYDNSSLVYTGEFTINDCSFDDYSKVVSVKHTMRDIYTQIQENEDVEVNIITSSDEITMDIYSYFYFFVQHQEIGGDLTYAKALRTVSPDLVHLRTLMVTERVILHNSTEAPAGWHYMIDDGEFKIYERYPVNFNLNFVIDWSSSEDQSDYRWSGDVFYRPPVDESTHTFYKLSFTTSSTAIISWSELWVKKSAYDGRANVALTQTYNAKDLKSALDRVLSLSNPNFTGTTKSTFLFNDTADRVVSSAYSSLYNARGKYLIEMSDFKKPNAYQNSTTGLTTFSKLITYLCGKHNARWIIDNNGDFRIEHISYFDNTVVGLDKSSDTKIPLKYNYLQGKKPNREYLTEGYAWSKDFAQIEMLYGTVPAVNGTKESTNSISLSDFYTDVDALNTHLSELPDNGFIYVEVSFNAVVKGTGFKSGGTLLQNVGLSNANCLNTYYRHDAYQDTFTIGGKSVTALSLKKMKVQKLEFMSDSVPDVSKKMETPVLTGVFKELSYNTVEECKFKAELHE